MTFHLTEDGLSGDPDLDMGQRLIPREPMYMIMNLGMAENFSPSKLASLSWLQATILTCTVSLSYSRL